MIITTLRNQLPFPLTLPLQNSIQVLVAKIGRFDSIQENPELLPALLNSLPTSTFNASCFNKLLKELATQRLLLHKKNFAAISTASFPSLANLFVSTSATLGSQLNQTDAFYTHYNILAKILHKLVTHTLPSLVSIENTSKLLSVVLHTCQTTISTIMSKSPSPPQPNTPLYKILNRLTLISVDAQSNHPLPFAPYLTVHLNFFYEVLTTLSRQKPEGEPFPLQKVAINTCNFLCNVKSERGYDPTSSGAASSRGSAITSKGDASAEAAECNLKVAAASCHRFFTTEVCTILANIAICALMPLTRNDLEEWQNDPEAYMVTVEQATVSDDAHAAGQQLFLTLQESKIGRPLLSKFLLDFLLDYDSQLKAASLEAASISAPSVQFVGDLKVLQWDAIYSAAGIAASSLENQIDFIDWFCKALAPALTTIMQSPAASASDQNTVLPVLRHRIVWLLGCFVNALSDTLRPQIYNALVSVLNHDSVKSDAMVKLTCVQTLNGLFEDWDFDIPSFHSLSAPTIRGLYALLDRVEELESSTLILQTCSVLVARMGMTLGAEAANAVVLPLLQIWELAGDKNVLRKYVLTILTNVSAAVSAEEVTLLYPVVQPMLDLSTGGGNAHVYLTDDALRLWLALMRVAPEYNEGFHLLFPKISNIVVNMDWEHLKVCMLILESYIFVGGQTFWSQYAGELSKMYLSLVGNVKAKAATYIMLSVDALMRKFPLEGSQMLLEGGVYKSILNCCKDVISDAKEREPDIILVQWISVIGRGLIANRNAVAHGLFVTNASTYVCSPKEFLGLMLEKFDSTGYGWGKTGQIRRRVWACALASLLPGADGPVGGVAWEGTWDNLMLKNLDQVINVFVDVLTEDAAAAAAGSEGEQFYDSEEETLIGGAEEYEKKLRTEIANDPVVTVNLKAFVKSRIDGCAIAMGQDRWREAIESCEPVVVQQLMKLFVE
ncbi:hypothetical protein TrST_g2981 [Triparma strigata]|nr:hypothetical protein TrST_g2981 [Triparma strigata]